MARKQPIITIKMLRASLVPLFIWALFACGGGGSGGNNGESISQDGSTINAFYSKGPVTEATATLHDSDNRVIAGPVMTDQGLAIFENVIFDGLVYASFQGGRYIDEATGLPVSLDPSFNIRSGVFRNTVDGVFEVVATPLTEIAFQRAEAATGGAPLWVSTVNLFLEDIADEFGLDSINLATVVPTSLASITSTSENDRYGAVLAAISQQQLDAGVPPNSSALSS